MLLNAMFSHHETDFIAISQISPSTAKNGSTARRRVLLVFLFEPSFLAKSRWSEGLSTSALGWREVLQAWLPWLRYYA